MILVEHHCGKEVGWINQEIIVAHHTVEYRLVGSTRKTLWCTNATMAYNIPLFLSRIKRHADTAYAASVMDLFKGIAKYLLCIALGLFRER